IFSIFIAHLLPNRQTLIASTLIKENALQKGLLSTKPEERHTTMLLHTLTLLLPFFALTASYYFLIYVPQHQQATNVTFSEIKAGDKIITRGGLIGTVHHKLTTTILVQLYDGSLIEITQDSIVKIIKK
ncbi:preprotein translocase subunit YajC, partial [Candidatus Babeliales bacterium]|nr:preprotein translocase subunit YajC [Candidatus Babeliales bacterium]